MRIVSWNIENLARWLDADGRRALGEHVERLGAPDVLCLQEIRLRPRDTGFIAAAHEVLPGYRCHLALADDAHNVTFRGGRQHGVATFVREELGGVVAATPAWDREGRVVATALPDARLAIINVYAVNGTSRPYRDPDTGAAMGDRHGFKRAFQGRVFDLGRELRENADVVMAGDWNVSRTAADVTPRLRTEEPHARARAELNARIADDNWRDAFRELHPDARAYSWFGRTRTGALDAARVDYILVSAELMPRVSEAQILDERDMRPRSDHAPLVIELT